MKRTLWAAVSNVAILSVCALAQTPEPLPRRLDSFRIAGSEQIVTDSVHLTGSRIVRYRPIGTTLERVLNHGERMPNGGCGFTSRGPTVANWSEWVEEYDLDTCTQIRGRGPGDGGPHLTASGQHREYFATTMKAATASPGAQTHLSVDEALIYIRTPAEGISTIPAAVRTRVLSDPATIQFYADLILGRRAVAAHWNQPVALWWVAESGDRRYIPIFLLVAPANLQVTEPGPNADLMQLGAYGLARNASVPVAASRLRQLLRGTPLMRGFTVGMLMMVNDSAARTLLRDVPRDSLAREQHALLDKVLAAPAARSGEGHAFCAEGEEVFGQDSRGSFHCVPARSRLRVR